MKGLLDAIARFFQSLFGGGKASSTIPTPPVIPQPDTSTVPDPVEPSDTSSGTGSQIGDALVVELKRYDKGANDILGKLSVGGEVLCHSLEKAGPKGQIPAGNYPLSLRNKGGLHATYSYRFGKKHFGMLQVGNAPNTDFAFLRVGNMASETDGGLVVGETVHNENAPDREVWNSETSYKKVYSAVVDHLRKGGKAEIRISES